jgi:GxxExxY protein
MVFATLLQESLIRLDMNESNDLTYKIIGCAMEVYKTLGPGLLESVYEQALIYELELNGLDVKSQVAVDVVYKGKLICPDLRVDLLIDDTIIIELKSVEELKPVHHKQILTYLRLMNKKVGLLINFNVPDLKDGIKRVINGFC